MFRFAAISLSLTLLSTALTSVIVFSQRRTFPTDIGSLVYETGHPSDAYYIYWGGLNHTLYATAAHFLLDPMREWQARFVDSVDCAPDGRSILIASGFLYRMEVANRALTRLTSEFELFSSVAWSRDGKRIAYSNYGETYLIAADGSNSSQLMSTQYPVHSLSWSPDDRQIVFAYFEEIDGQHTYSIRLVDVATGVWHSIYETSELIGDTSWSPDGKQIIFMMSNADGLDIYTIQPDGTQLTRLTQGGINIQPHWSPDGSLISYSSRRDNADNYRLYVMNAEGSQPYLVYVGYSINYALGADDVYNDCWLKIAAPG